MKTKKLEIAIFYSNTNPIKKGTKGYDSMYNNSIKFNSKNKEIIVGENTGRAILRHKQLAAELFVIETTDRRQVVIDKIKFLSMNKPYRSMIAYYPIKELKKLRIGDIIEIYNINGVKEDSWIVPKEYIYIDEIYEIEENLIQIYFADPTADFRRKQIFLVGE